MAALTRTSKAAIRLSAGQHYRADWLVVLAEHHVDQRAGAINGTVEITPPGRPEGFHLQPPTEPCVNLSTYTARPNRTLATSR
jgi:hypothetical protein